MEIYKGFSKLPIIIIFASSFAPALSASAFADNYPVEGAWSFLNPNAPGNEKKDCEAFRRYGLTKLSGNIEGDFTVFRGAKRYDFGGYMDNEKQNVSVKQVSPAGFDISERYYHDGEGGGRAGYKIKRSRWTMISADRIEIIDGQYKYKNVLVRCDSILPAPQANSSKSPLLVVPKSDIRTRAAKPTKPIELADLIRLFVLPSDSVSSLLDWHDASPENSPVAWTTLGLDECAPALRTKYRAVACRAGTALAIIAGKPTHRILRQTSSPGTWNVQLLGARNGASVALISSDVNSQELDRDALSKALSAKQLSAEVIKRSCWETTGTDLYRIRFAGRKPTKAAVSYSCGSGGCGIEIVFTVAEESDDRIFEQNELPCSARAN